MGRDMPIIPTSLSLLATYMSPILVLGYAGEIYSYGTLMVETIFGAIVFVPIAALIFMPTMYPLRLTSAYEVKKHYFKFLRKLFYSFIHAIICYLEYRYESRVVRILAALTFTIQIICYMGVVLFAPSLALNAVVDFPIPISVVVMGLSCAVYTAIGGLKAVVWTDVFQMLIMLAGMFAIVIGGALQVGGYSKVFQIAQDHQRIKFLNLNVDFFERLNSLNILLGNGIMVLSVCGCQQTAVQRYCSMSSLKKAILTILITLPLVVFTVGLAALAGVVIFANYADCDPITLGLIKRNDQIAPYFVLEFLSSTGGLLGLFIACLFSASLSTVSSGLNSLTAVTWEDFLGKTEFFQKMSEKAQGQVSKLVGLIYGLLCIGMAFLAANFDGVLGASIVLNGSVAGPLLGVFLLGLLVPFANKWGAIVGMLVGHTITILICVGAGLLNIKSPTLPFSVDGCSDNVWDTVGNKTEIYLRSNITVNAVRPEIEWPQKIHTVSFLLYPVIGCTICVVVGLIVSFITGIVCPGTNFLISPKQEKYVHPLLAKLIRMFRKPGNYYNGGSGKSLELSTSYSYSNGYPSEAPAVQSNMNGLNGTYTKRSSSLGRNLDVGP
ncbi:Sodium-dependent multivitamin transporter [Orchesella cincta]|uniref:Sodium-dependent multivitamin transporter n=1 Tax=Orchesella cincta TaxID=48709 RepID=A0A1D2MXR3_ORCCI|nr:Sodium-dependent multivitamin transporter [Orchesella cincta]